MKIKYRSKGKSVEENFDIRVEGVDNSRDLDLTARPVVRLYSRKAVMKWRDAGQAGFGSAVVLWSYDHRLGWGAGVFDPQTPPVVHRLDTYDLDRPGDWVAAGTFLIKACGWVGRYPAHFERTPELQQRVREALLAAGQQVL